MTKQLTRSAVRIYGALSGLGKGSKSILDRLLPFFEPLLRAKNGERLDPTEFARDVRETYKWNFTSDLVESFVPNFLAAGWIQADVPNAKDTTYTINMPALDVTGDSEDSSIEAELHSVAAKFQTFAQSLSPLTTLPRNVEEFEDILIEWLLYVEAFSEKNIDFKHGFRPDSNGKLRQFVEVPRLTSLQDEEQFLCARFVDHALRADQSTSEVLARIAAIGLLTEVVQDFVKPTSNIQRSNVVVYLDGPVALELLGVSGKAARDNIAPLIAELLHIGASVRIFGQSIEEMKLILQAVLRSPRPTGPTAQALMRNEVLKEYVQEVAQDPGLLLEKEGVKPTYRRLEQTPSEHQYFTEADRTEMYGALRFQENPHAREHDADITTLVMRQRRGKYDRDLFKSGAIILTRNGLLAQVAQRKCVDLNRMPSGMVPPVVHRRVLATAMWLRTGLGASDLSIPKRLLLASCERVLAIRPGVVDAVKRVTDALGDEEKSRQLDLLISEDRSARVLMDKTLGAANVVTTENFSLLFEEMLQPHLEDERDKGSQVVKEVRAQSRKHVARVAQQMEVTEKERDEAASMLQARRIEDREIILALCNDVSSAIVSRRRWSRGIAVLFALASCIPIIMPSTWTMKVVAVSVAALFAYLTLTGGRLLSIHPDQSEAVALLRATASMRRLDSKLDQFDVSWVDGNFKVLVREPSGVQHDRSDLLSTSPL